MPFQPKVGEELQIENDTYQIAAHPMAPGMPYGQEGRQATVYQLLAGPAGPRALKVFKPRYRLPLLAYLAERIEEYADLPGLAVCRRTVLTPQRHGALLRQYPDLTYAVLMPWIQGPTWMQVLLEKRSLTAAQSLELAGELANVLATLEQHGLAHCDLSAPNVLIPTLVGEKGVALVDIEQMYGPGLRPALAAAGSPGYAHKTAPEGLWTPEADRFAGAVLLAEMLGWCDERVRSAAWGENYFEPREVQQETQRYKLLTTALEGLWGTGLAGLFERGWHSDTLSECATFGEWLVLLPQEVPTALVAQKPEPGRENATLPVPDAGALMEAAQRLEQQGRLDKAVEIYRQAQALAPKDSAMAQELALIIGNLQQRLQPGDETQALFEAGRAAYERQEWAKAKELLAEVVRRQAGYERNGQQASALLRDVEHRLVAAPSRTWVWVLLALALLVAGAAVLYQQTQQTARTRATATAMAVATATAQARNTATSVARATVAAQQTYTAVARSTAAAQGTAMALSGPRATAHAEQTTTAAEQETRTVLAQETAAVAEQATATARAQATTAAAKTATAKAGTAAQPSAPTLLSPGNGESLSGDTVTFRWQWARTLKPDEHFDVRVWPESGKPQGIAWTESTTFGPWRPEGSGKYYWSILVLRQTGTRADGTKEWEAVSPESEVRWFSYAGAGPGAAATETKPPPLPTKPGPTAYP